MVKHICATMTMREFQAHLEALPPGAQCYIDEHDWASLVAAECERLNTEYAHAGLRHKCDDVISLFERWVTRKPILAAIDIVLGRLIFERLRDA